MLFANRANGFGCSLPALRPVATSRRSATERLQQRHRNSPTSFSRFLGFSGWVDSLAAEAPEVLLHAGFGIQILSMRVCAGGLGLSQGTDGRLSIEADPRDVCEESDGADI